MKKWPRFHQSLTALGVVLAATQMGHFAAKAQETEEFAEGETILLDEVIILSADEQLKQAPGVSIIDSGDIERRPPANDLSDIIRRQPGVNLTGNSAAGVRGNNRQIDIRGMGPENTLILIDGKPVLSRNSVRYGRTGERDTRGDSNWVPAEAVERIEVLRGPAAARYGSGASGGVVNIITKRPETTTVNVSTYVNIPYHSEEGETVRFNVFAGGPLGQYGAYRIYGNYNRTNADDPAINQTAYEGTGETDTAPAGREGVENRDVRGVFTWHANDQNEFDFEAAYSRQGNIFAGDRQLSAVTDFIEEFAAEGAETNTMYRTTLSGTHRGTYGWGSTNSYVQWENTRNSRYLEGTAGSTEGGINTDEKGTITLDNWTAKSEANIPFSYYFDQNVTLGAEFRGERLDDPISTRQVIDGDFPGIIPNPDDRDSTIDAQLYALYIENNIYVTDQLVVTPGVRADYHSDFGANLSPSLNASYDITDEVALKVGIARAFKTPNLYQLNPNYVYTSMGMGCWQQSGLSGACYIVGNPDLQPETSINKEIGLSYTNDTGWAAGVTYFHNDYKDRIAAGYERVGTITGGTGTVRNVFQWENTPEAVVSGIEGNLLVPLLDTLNWRTNATYMIESEDKTTGQPLSLIPEYTINSALEWQATDRLQFILSAAHYGKTEAATISFSTGEDVTDLDPIDPYTIVNIGVDFEAHENLRLGAGVTNLFDERLFRTSEGANTYNEPGRAFYFRATATF